MSEDEDRASTENHFSGTTGKIVQAGAIHGDVNFYNQPITSPEKSNHGVTVRTVQGDQTWAAWICALLRQCGYSVTQQSLPLDRIEELDNTAIDSSRTILVYSQLSSRSAHYRNLWEQRISGDPPLRTQTLIVQVDDAKIVAPPDVRIRPHASHTEAMTSVQAGLINSGWPHEHLSNSRKLRKIYPGRGPRINNLPPRNMDFTGRKELIENLALKLLTRETDTTCHALIGLSGIGKSQTALEYAHRYSSHYDLIWHVIAEEPSTIKNDLESLANQLGIEDTASHSSLLLGIRQKLTNFEQWLVIFDNAEDAATLQRYWPGLNGHILVTSNKNANWWLLAAQEIQVQAMNRDEAISYLRKRFHWVRSAAYDTNLVKIIDKLQCLPLALDQAASYITSTRCTLHEYVRLLDTRFPEMLAISSGNYKPSHETIFATVSLTLEKVRQRHPEAERFLLICSFLAPDRIRKSIFREHSSTLPDDLASAVADPLELGRIIETLRRFSLLEADGETISTHRLVQIISRESQVRDRLAEVSALANAAIHLLESAFPSITYGYGSYSTCTQLVPHVISVRNFGDLSSAHRTLALLLVRCGEHVAESQEASLALDMLEQAHRTLGNEPGDNLISLLTASARAHFELARLGAAQEAAETALNMSEELFGERSSKTLKPLSQLANIVLELADLKRARTLTERAMSIVKPAGDESVTHTAGNLMSLGVILWRQGFTREAHRTFIRSLELTKDDPRSIQHAHANELTAITSRELGMIDAARSHQKAAREILIKNLGQQSMLVARLGVGSAMILLEEEKFEEAEAQAAESAAILAQWQENHPNTASALNVHGDALRALGHAGRAIDLHARAWKIFTETYGPEHPYNAEARERLGADYHQSGNVEKAEETLHKALSILLNHYGANYPRSIFALRHLKILYTAQGRTNDADDVSRQISHLSKVQNQ